MVRGIFPIKTTMGNQCWLDKTTPALEQIISMSYMHKMATHCAYTLTESSKSLIILGKMYMVNTLQFLGKFLGKQEKQYYHFERKIATLFFCISISNQDLDKT